MKNSVFYGSGIQWFFNQELGKHRKKFIENKNLWFSYVMIYLKILF